MMTEPPPAKLIWGDISNQQTMLTTALPFRVSLTAVGEDKEPLPDYTGQLTISALTAKICLSEGFEGRRLGLWCALYRPSPPVSAHHLPLHAMVSDTRLRKAHQSRAPARGLAGCRASCPGITSTASTRPSVRRARATRSSSRAATTRILG